MIESVKRLLETLEIVRLIWLTESFEHEGYRTELRIVRTHGPNREPWCWNLGESNRRVRLLPDGSCKSRFTCTWQPYNERSPKPDEIKTRDQVKTPEAGSWKETK